MLRRFGMGILVPLLEHDFEVTVRPHPQSYIVEQEMLTELQTALSVYQNIKWDSNPDNFDSLSEADLMVSDISGIMFDYSFLFARPVISIEFEPDWLGTECFDMDSRAFELTVLDRIGRQIGSADIPSLPDIAHEILASPKTAAQIESLREKMTVNFGHAGQVAATQVLALTKKQ